MSSKSMPRFLPKRDTEGLVYKYSLQHLLFPMAEKQEYLNVNQLNTDKQNLGLLSECDIIRYFKREKSHGDMLLNEWRDLKNRSGQRREDHRWCSIVSFTWKGQGPEVYATGRELSHCLAGLARNKEMEDTGSFWEDGNVTKVIVWWKPHSFIIN